MKIVVSQRVAQEYGERIREADPWATLVVPSMMGEGVVWSEDVAAADACCFSEDFWQDEEMRRAVLPVVFRLAGLKWFHTFSAGVDSPAFQALIERGTMLTNSAGASAPSIAQYVLAMMLYRTKPIEAWREQQQRGEWRQMQTSELTGQTAGIIGTGAIGGEVAWLAKACGMRVLGVRRSKRRAKYVDEQYERDRLHDMLGSSDFVVISCPLTRETEGLIDDAELRAMKPTATLINVARGRVVREQALVRALRDGRIACAVLDVFEQEPLPADSELWRLPNAIVTPHNSGFSPLNMARSMEIFLDNLGRLVQGKPLRNRVRRAGAG